MPSKRFAVLHHTGCAVPHFDFMLEGLDDRAADPTALATFRAVRWPVSPGDELEQLSAHRSAFLTYEGPLTDDRGTVRRVERGMYTLIRRDAWLLQIEIDAENAAARYLVSIVRARDDRSRWTVQPPQETKN